MKKYLLLLIFLMTFVVCEVRGQEAFHKLDFATACSTAKKEGKAVLIDFYTTWCGPCKRLDKTTWQDKVVIAWLNEKTISLRVDAEQEIELAERYKVRAYPTIILLGNDGKEIDRLVGYKDSEEFLNAANDALAGKASFIRAKEKLEKDENNSFLRLNYAKALANNKKYEEALEQYLWGIKYGAEKYPKLPEMAFINGIGLLGKDYPPAITVLKDYRDKKEKALFSKNVKKSDVFNFNRANELLNEQQNSLRVFDQLTLPQQQTTKQELATILIDKLLAAKRYQDIIGNTPSVVEQINNAIKVYDMNLNNEKLIALDVDKEIANFLKDSVAEEGGKYYEALLAINKQTEASKVVKKLLEFDNSAKTYLVLIQHAKNVGAKSIATKLTKKGLSSLPKEESKILKETLNSLNNKKHPEIQS